MSETPASPVLERRTEELHLRVTPSEKAEIEQRAIQYSGRVGKLVSISQYLRVAALDQDRAA